MGAQASTASADAGDAASGRESGTSRSERALDQSNVRAAESGSTRSASATATSQPLVRTTTAVTAAAARPPTAPASSRQRKPPVVDRVVEIRGTVKHAYPLQSPKGKNRDGAGDEFSVGSGPCGRDAAQVVAWEVQLHDSYETCFVFLYDKWADAVRRFQRHYKVHVRGRGLVAIDHWDIGHDTEDVKRCYVVAEKLLLKRTAERSPRLLPKPQGITIEVAYEEPQRIPDSDQVKYLPEQLIHERDLYDAPTPAPAASAKPSQTKAAMANPAPQEKPNPRGKRALREINAAVEAGAQIMTPSSYVYTPLAELIPGNACLYGVVVNMSLPKRSQGHDFYMSLHVVDESLPRREDALQVMVFLPTIEQMPRILHVGDVVRFHKIRINRYQDKLQGVCNPRATRYLVLRRDQANANHVIQQTCSSTWTFERYDEDRFAQLADWSDRVLCIDKTLPPGCPQPPRLLADMQYAESFADVVVRVLHIQEPYEDFTVARLIIWDGSGDSSSSQDLYSKLRREKLAHENAVPFIPERGLLMEVVVDSCWIVMQTMGILSELPSHWCRFRNLSVSSEQGEPSGEAGPGGKHWFELHFREVSSVMILPVSSSDVQIRTQQSSNGSQVQAIGFTAQTPESTAVIDLTEPETSTIHDSVQRVMTQVPAFISEKVSVTSLQRVLASPNVPRKYHCCARVVAIWPSNVEQLAKPKSPTDDTYIYSFVIRLEDTTGQIDVIVHGDDAEKFVHGIPPCNLTKSTSSRSLLKKRVGGLLSLHQPVHFCIKSYKPKLAQSNQGNPGDDSVRFRVFDTLLLSAP